MVSVKRIIALLLALMLVLVSMVGCASKGQKLMELDGEEMSVNIFQLYLSRMKGMLCTTTYYGNSATQASFWDTWKDAATWTTYNQHYTNAVLESVKGSLAAVALFEKEGLKLPNSVIDEIDEEMKRLVDEEADGSKTTLNAILKSYGVNYEMLREAYIIEAKIEYLEKYLFGENGSKVGADIIDSYYKENYARFKQVFLFTFEYVYDTDVNGDHVYYKDDGKISYDTDKGEPKKTDNGGYVLDAKGDRVYYYTDESGKERIAYKKTGASRNLVTDSSGNAITRPYNDTEIEILTEEANDILAQCKKGDTVSFDALVTKYSEDKGLKDYPDGYYVTKDTVYEVPKVIEELFGMEVGDYKMLKSDYGIHIFMRYDIEDGAYADEDYDDIFIDMKTGTYVFMDELVAKLLSDYLEPYKARIVVDEKVLATADIKRAGINFYY